MKCKNTLDITRKKNIMVLLKRCKSLPLISPLTHNPERDRLAEHLPNENAQVNKIGDAWKSKKTKKYFLSTSMVRYKIAHECRTQIKDTNLFF